VVRTVGGDAVEQARAAPRAEAALGPRRGSDPCRFTLDDLESNTFARALMPRQGLIDPLSKSTRRPSPFAPGEGFAELEEFRSIWESSGGRSHHRTATGYLAISRSGVTSV
jgi:hypothetical protein